MFYEAVWYNGWIDPPAYIVLGEVEGDIPELAPKNNLAQLTRWVREIYQIQPEEWHDGKIQDTLYVLKNDMKISLEILSRSGLV